MNRRFRLSVLSAKYYLQPEIEVMEPEMEQELLAYSVTSEGLGEKLTHDDTTPSGNSWDEALSRRSVWDDEE